MKLKENYHIYAIATITLWSLAYVFTRLALQHFSASSLGVLRYSIASIGLLAIAFAMKIRPPKPSELPSFIISGACGFFLYMVTFNVGSITLTAATGAVIVATAPIITALLARVLFKEKLKNYQWLAIAVEFAGILILTLMNGVFSINIGVIWMLGASLSLALYNLTQRRLTKKYTSLQSSFYSIFAGTILLLMFLPGALNEVKTAPPVQLFYIVFLGIFPSATAYVLWSKALALATKTTYVSNYMFVTPFITAIFGFLIADELPDMATLAGGLVIMLGILLFNKENFVGKKSEL